MTANLGHEIGFHYENLSLTKGDYSKAMKLFEEDLEKLRRIVDISTICMHGSPMSKWNNSDLWKKYDFKKYGITGESYLSINYTDIGYFTDTGRTWCNKGSVRDFVNSSIECKDVIRSTDDLINLIQDKELNKLVIVAHPQRWNIKSSKWLKELIAQNIKNIGKDLILKRKRR
jgi:hypothetical protein